MLDSIVITAANEAADNARDLAKKNYALSECGIAIEVIRVDKNGEYNWTCSFERIIGENPNAQYRKVLREYTSSSHGGLLEGRPKAPFGWSGSPYVCLHDEIVSPHGDERFSIMACAVGGTRSQNETLAKFVLDSIAI